MENIKNLLMSFVYAFRGIGYMIRTERNMRIHITCLIYMFSILIFSDWFVISKTEYVLLLLTSALVLAAETFNTAIENSVNLYGEKRTENGKIAKDAAAGAVLICAIISVIVGIIIMFQPQAFIKMAQYFIANPIMILVVIISLAVATVFIFYGFDFRRRK
ncbi:MAG: diacylglycerol kinase family protein [Clostridia bacterium]|nr:diacylglycerol kinase family protein [Clostridia bacterium]